MLRCKPVFAIVLVVVLAGSLPAAGQWPVSKGLEKDGRPPSPPGNLSVNGSSGVVEKADAVLVVRFEGGDVPAAAARVLRLLLEQRVIDTEAHTVSDGDRVCDLYRRYTNFPGQCSRELIELASWINGKRLDNTPLRINQDLLVPVASFEEYLFSMRLAPASNPADRDRLIELRANWSWLITEQSKTSDGLVQLRLRGYQLRVSVPDANVAALKQAVFKAPSPNVLVGIIPAKSANRVYHVVDDAKKFFLRCRNRAAGVGDRGSMMRLVGADSRGCARACVGRDCPGTVVLVDSSVHRHPDLADAVVDSEGRSPVASPPGDGGARQCELVDPFNETEHHGTYMAGIMAAGGANSRLLGIDPDTKLISLRWDSTTNEFAVRDRMDDVNQGLMRVFVLATSWEISSGFSETVGFRYEQHPISKFVKDNYVRLVAAAGQKPGTPGIEIGPKSLAGPMNLGDLPNVIVVTACDDCDPRTARLRTDANYGNAASRFVHVAAPGSDIPSTASEKAYAVQSGTSPAAALVGGLAAAMLGCYPGLAEPGKLKERIQVTSRPIIGDDRDKVATGVVDASLAFLDPRLNYARLVGTSLAPVTVEGWCQDRISLKDARTGDAIENGELDPKNVLRIVRVTEGDRPEWVVYARKREQPGLILKVGPGTMGPFDTPAPGRFANLDKPLIRLKGTGNVPLRKVEDLLVQAALGMTACQR